MIQAACEVIPSGLLFLAVILIPVWWANRD